MGDIVSLFDVATGVFLCFLNVITVVFEGHRFKLTENRNIVLHYLVINQSNFELENGS